MASALVASGIRCRIGHYAEQTMPSRIVHVGHPVYKAEYKATYHDKAGPHLHDRRLRHQGCPQVGGSGRLRESGDRLQLILRPRVTERAGVA